MNLNDSMGWILNKLKLALEARGDTVKEVTIGSGNHKISVTFAEIEADGNLKTNWEQALVDAKDGAL